MAARRTGFASPLVDACSGTARGRPSAARRSSYRTTARPTTNPGATLNSPTCVSKNIFTHDITSKSYDRFDAFGRAGGHEARVPHRPDAAPEIRRFSRRSVQAQGRLRLQLGLLAHQGVPRARPRGPLSAQARADLESGPRLDAHRRQLESPPAGHSHEATILSQVRDDRENIFFLIFFIFFFSRSTFDSQIHNDAPAALQHDGGAPDPRGIRRRDRPHAEPLRELHLHEHHLRLQLPAHSEGSAAGPARLVHRRDLREDTPRERVLSGHAVLDARAQAAQRRHSGAPVRGEHAPGQAQALHVRVARQESARCGGGAQFDPRTVSGLRQRRDNGEAEGRGE
ncbi:unnamed protein product [Trichogramma brassicae]|uniref:Uncharacterized protein n=1 Tax=Trichogramma brassicae TaxID=86971 RepID=A0A6H5J5L9_9HYME|nr:unnamed protein product [Trichogramma brassicae]